MQPTNPKKPVSDWLIRAGYLIVIAALVMVLLPPSPDRRRRQPQCPNNLKQIVLAMHNYYDKERCFPPAYFADANGKPMHSWRVLILPHLEKDELYKAYRFEEPWDGPNNRLLADKIDSIFRCPEDKAGSKTETNYVVVVGSNTAFPPIGSLRFKDFEKDGIANTIMIVESKNSGISWMEPRDLSFDDAVRGINHGDGAGIASNHEGGVYMALGDGAVRFVADTIPQETLRRLLERNDGLPVGDF